MQYPLPMPEPPPPTNLLFICSDEHTSRVLGCYGNPLVRTPHLDALAARGTRFSSAYTPFPICVPARACLATGRYAHQLGIWDNGAPYTGREAPSWGHRLTARGRQVTTIGKLHYRDAEDDTGFPDQRLPMHVLDGVGDVFGLLRGDSPVRPGSVRTPGAGGRAGRVGVRALRPGHRRGGGAVAARARRAPIRPPLGPLRLLRQPPLPPASSPSSTSTSTPPNRVPLPRCGTPDTWSTHPAIQWKRRIQAIEEPFPEPTLRRAIAAYYGMVTFLDEQIGRVLAALDAAGLTATTRVVYSTDHGEMLGDHGLWWKSVMFEGAAGIPLLLAGPDVPAGKTVATPVSLVDLFPTILEATGVAPEPEDADLPGASLLRLAREPDDDRRAVFSEYHASHSSTGYYLVRRGRHKLVHYANVAYPPQLFDLQADPAEAHDLAADPAHAPLLAELEGVLRTVVDPEAVDAAARADQRRRIDAAGGVEAVLGAGARFNYTPAPAGFDPPPCPVRPPPRRRHLNNMKMKQVAAVVTEYRVRSHADNIVTRLLEGYELHWTTVRPSVRVASLYTDQVPAGDLSRDLAGAYGVPIYPTIGEALTLGGETLAVDGVVLVGEHGDYPHNEKGQKQYPRRRFFEETVAVFDRSRAGGARLHGQAPGLQLGGREVDLRHRPGAGHPPHGRLVHAGHRPRAPAGGPLRGGDRGDRGGGPRGLESYGFHALEIGQCLAERRAGHETGVSAVQCLTGPAFWRALQRGGWLVAGAGGRRPGGRRPRPRRRARALRRPDRVPAPRTGGRTSRPSSASGTGTACG